MIAVMVAFVQGLWRRQRQCSDCGGGIGAVIVASTLVGAVIVAAALVGAVIVAEALVGAVIVVAVSAQRLWGRWRSNCSGGSVGAAITAAAALVQ